MTRRPAALLPSPRGPAPAPLRGAERLMGLAGASVALLTGLGLFALAGRTVVDLSPAALELLGGGWSGDTLQLLCCVCVLPLVVLVLLVAFFAVWFAVALITAAVQAARGYASGYVATMASTGGATLLLFVVAAENEPEQALRIAGLASIELFACFLSAAALLLAYRRRSNAGLFAKASPQ